jgi:hypothetical protein
MRAIPAHTRYNTNQRIPRKSNISANPSWGCRVPVGWSLGTEQAQWGELAASAALFFDLWREHPPLASIERHTPSDHNRFCFLDRKLAGMRKPGRTRELINFGIGRGSTP